MGSAEAVAASARDSFLALCGHDGQTLVSDHLRGDTDAGERLGSLIDAANEGLLDDVLGTSPDIADVHVTTSAHLLAVAVMNRLTGMVSADLYKGDPVRYVRINLLIQRLLGFQRLTVGIPVYAFGAESLGQAMMYPDDQAPGSDPGNPLVAIERWSDIPAYDSGNEVIRIVTESLIATSKLAGIEPVAHLPAPYSFAAEIFGQEHLINALNTEPDTVRSLLKHLTEVVLAPWCADLVSEVPDVWIELSDASGSPMFIGPANFLSFAVEPVKELISQPDFGPRVFVANYRGDSPPRSATRGRRRNQVSTNAALSFEGLLDAKVECCPFLITRLEADAASEQTYADAAISRGIPLYLGIGAVRLDRNSVVDHEAGVRDLYETAYERASIIRQVRNAPGADGVFDGQSWPGDLYIEDTNGETDMELLAAVLEGCADANQSDGVG